MTGGWRTDYLQHQYPVLVGAGNRNGLSCQFWSESCWNQGWTNKRFFLKNGVDHAAINGNVQNPRHHYHHRPGGGRRTVLFLVQPGSISPDSGQELGERVNDLLQGGSLRRSVHQQKQRQPALPDELLTAERAVLSVGANWNLSQAGSDVFNVTWGSSDQIKLEPPKIVSRNPTRRQVPQGLIFCIG